MHQTCPLCDSASVIRSVKRPIVGKIFDCKTCGSYLIDMEAEQYLASLPELAFTEHRLKLSKYAQSMEKGALLVIHLPEPNDPRSSRLEHQTTMVVTSIYPKDFPEN